jgi:hypothetical protein
MSKLQITDLATPKEKITELLAEIQDSVFGGVDGVLINETHSFGRDRYYYDTDGDGKWDYKEVYNSHTGYEIKTKWR